MSTHLPAPGTLPAGVALRDGHQEDARALAAFHTECWRDAYRGIVPDEHLARIRAAEHEQRWRERMSSGVRRVVVAEHDGFVAGVVTWALADAPDLPAVELKSLYVAAAWRGTGLARALLDTAIGDEPAFLWVFAANQRARTFYEKCGFGFDGELAVDPKTGVEEVRYVRGGGRR